MRKFSLVLLVLLVLIGCSEEPEKVTIVEGESTEELIILLASEDSYIALKSSEKLVKRGEEVVPELLKVLWLPDTGNRRGMAIQTLKGIGEPAITALISTLNQADFKNRSEVQETSWQYDIIKQTLVVIALKTNSEVLKISIVESINEYDRKIKRLFPPAAEIVMAIPPSGSQVAATATIALAFDQPVQSVAGATGSGKNWTVLVARKLSITWTNNDGSQGGPMVLAYLVDQTASKISGGNVKNGAKDVDPRPLNERGVVIEFSEKVSLGTAQLKPEGGEFLGTGARWEAKKVTLILLAGKTLANKTTYVIRIRGVKDVAGNALEGGTVKFTTKGKE